MPAWMRYFFVILLFVVMPSAIRTLGIYEDEFYRFQQSLGGDKATHFVIGFALVIGLYWVSQTSLKTLRFLFLCLLAIGVLVIEELFQLTTPGRHFELLDLAWGLSGLAISVIAIYLFEYLRVKLRS